MEIIRFGLEDFDEILELQYSAYPKEVWDSPEETRTFFGWEVCHGIKIDNIVKAIVMGYVKDDFFHIYSVEVSPDCRKTGMASKLIEFCIDYAKNNHLNTVRAYGFSQGGKNLLKKYNFVKTSEKNLLHYVMDVMYLDLTNKM